MLTYQSSSITCINSKHAISTDLEIDFDHDSGILDIADEVDEEDVDDDNGGIIDALDSGDIECM